VDNLKPYLPEGVEVVYPYETAPMVSASIEAVVHTLFEAIVLVFLVMYLFLQNFRATLIPTLAVPVVLLATFGVLFACGFTINVMTMFAMVLAIGLLVDDAIVVVENVERIMVEEGLSPKEATRKSMGQISGALVGIALVISAVFLPMAFFGGSAGVIYRQFAITIISAMSFSVLIALVFTPALCATLLKPVAQGEHHEKRGFFGWFNRTFERSANGYQHLWVDATGMPQADNATLTWLNGQRFYTYRLLPPAGAKVILAESGANDPHFNLRREPVLIERLENATDATFVAVLEPHGLYDPDAETVSDSRSRIAALRHVRAADADLVSLELLDGRTLTLAIADDADAAKAHRAEIDGRPLAWSGHVGRFDEPAAGETRSETASRERR